MFLVEILKDVIQPMKLFLSKKKIYIYIYILAKLIYHHIYRLIICQKYFEHKPSTKQKHKIKNQNPLNRFYPKKINK